MLDLLLLTTIIVIGLGLVLILTDLVTVPPAVRANAVKVGTVVLLAVVVWLFVASAIAAD